MTISKERIEELQRLAALAEIEEAEVVETFKVLHGFDPFDPGDHCLQWIVNKWSEIRENKPAIKTLETVDKEMSTEERHSLTDLVGYGDLFNEACEVDLRLLLAQLKFNQKNAN